MILSKFELSFVSKNLRIEEKLLNSLVANLKSYDVNHTFFNEMKKKNYTISCYVDYESEAKKNIIINFSCNEKIHSRSCDFTILSKKEIELRAVRITTPESNSFYYKTDMIQGGMYLVSFSNQKDSVKFISDKAKNLYSMSGEAIGHTYSSLLNMSKEQIELFYLTHDYSIDLNFIKKQEFNSDQLLTIINERLISDKPIKKQNESTFFNRIKNML